MNSLRMGATLAALSLYVSLMSSTSEEKWRGNSTEGSLWGWYLRDQGGRGEAAAGQLKGWEPYQKILGSTTTSAATRPPTATRLHVTLLKRPQY
jgi:hypothetical protein